MQACNKQKYWYFCSTSGTLAFLPHEKMMHDEETSPRTSSISSKDSLPMSYCRASSTTNQDKGLKCRAVQDNSVIKWRYGILQLKTLLILDSAEFFNPGLFVAVQHLHPGFL